MDTFKRFKYLYLFVCVLLISVFASLVVLGHLLDNNIGKDSNTVTIALPSVSFKEEEDNLDEWTNVSEMTLFGSNYGGNRDKVIASGMSNSIELVVDNRNSGALDYEIVFHFSNNEEWLPLQFKITRYDGTALTNDYVGIETLDGLTDTHTLGRYRYAYYLVEWYWQDYDGSTELGNLALEKDMWIFASVNARTWKSEDQNSSNGIAIEYNHNKGWSVVNIVVGVLGVGSAVATCFTLYRLSLDYNRIGFGLYQLNQSSIRRKRRERFNNNQIRINKTGIRNSQKFGRKIGSRNG